ncbi:MAG: hypothetical protein AB1714_10335 [Acidobacteriota bacterium]
MTDNQAVGIGTVVRDSFGPEGIVWSKKEPPAEEWTHAVVDEHAIAKIGPSVRWWGVMPFGGGYLRCPEPMLTRLRTATSEDFLLTADHAGVPGRLRLAKVFPDYVDLLLERRRNSETSSGWLRERGDEKRTGE